MRVREELKAKEKTVTALAGQIASAIARNAEQERVQLEGERLATEAEVVGLESNSTILEERYERLKVGAPITGVVATFQLDQLLQNRPVQRGEVLMEVMDDKATWHLEVDVEDKRMGHILARCSVKETSDSPWSSCSRPIPKPVTTEPSRKSNRERKPIASSATSCGAKSRSTTPEELPRRRIGAEVRAKVNTGDRALGYVLFGDVIDFVRKHLWL